MEKEKQSQEVDELVITDPHEVAGILEDSASGGAPAAIALPGRAPVDCRLSFSESGTVELILDCQNSARVLAQGEAPVLIHSRGRRWKFAAVFKSWRWSESDGVVRVQIGPIDKMWAFMFRRNDRLSFETAKSELTCAVSGGQQSVPARVIDLSADGIGVSFDDDESRPAMDVGHRAVMILTYGELRCEIVAQLRWRRGKTCGFKFDRPIGQTIEPELQAIIQQVREALDAFAA